jgi:hypothetical protein
VRIRHYSCVDAGVTVEVELLELERDAVVWIELVELAADVGTSS